MKARMNSLCAALNFIALSTAFSQATFEMYNYHPFYGVDAPIYDAQGVPLAGSNYLAEVWGGASANSLTPAVDLVYGGRLIVPFFTHGYFYSSHAASIPQVPMGSFAWLQLRAWDARLGTTYEDALALGVGGYGSSPTFYARGGNPGALVPPAPLIGLQSFSLLPVVPEPSTWALLALGGTALSWRFLYRRRN